MDRLDDSMACMLMGFDGISVVSVLKDEEEMDLDLMGAEISSFVNQVRQASFVSQFGSAKEFVFRSDKTSILLQVLTDDYFVAIVMKPVAHVGKGRFLLKLATPKLLEELL